MLFGNRRDGAPSLAVGARTHVETTLFQKSRPTIILWRVYVIDGINVSGDLFVFDLPDKKTLSWYKKKDMNRHLDTGVMYSHTVDRRARLTL